MPLNIRSPQRATVVSLVLLLLSACSSQPKAPPVVATPVNLRVVHDALRLKGTPYRYGEETPDAGFDCSGFVQYVYSRHGIRLPRTAYQMAMNLPEPEEDALQPGDLVFFNTTGRPYSHVGIFIGRQRFVHASSAKGEVIVSSLDTPYWTGHFLGLRRPLDDDGDDGQPGYGYP